MFSNLFGVAYKKGNVNFSQDGTCLLSIIGNRLKVYDLRNNISKTMLFESDFNYVAMDISPDGKIIVAANEEGVIHVVSLASNVIINKYRLLGNIQAIKFSPNGKYLVVCKETNVYLFEFPEKNMSMMHPFYLRYVFTNSSDETTYIDWTCDSKFFAVASKNMSTYIYSCEKDMKYRAFELAGGHTDSIVACFFESNSLDITTISKNGQTCIWEANMDLEILAENWKQTLKPTKKMRKSSPQNSDIDDIVVNNERECSEDIKIPTENSLPIVKSQKTEARLKFKKLARHYLADEVRKSDKNAYLSAASYHKERRTLVTGYSNGAFYIHELPDMNLIHSLSAFNDEISTISINSCGEWIALGSSKSGQLVVWSWISECYVLKQQGHVNNICCVSYSLHGDQLATGSIDGKVKLWDVATGFCMITFSDHTEAVTDVVLRSVKQILFSASLDGTVRAFDTKRYRNFRIFTSPRPTQFSCLAVDSKCEFIAAGSQDSFDIYLWCMKSYQLLEILSSHTAPVSSLTFSPIALSTILLSASWDKTIKIWNAIEKGSDHETIEMLSDCLCCAFKPNGVEFAVATLNGQISVFDSNNCRQITCIEGRKDLDSGVSSTDLVSAKQNLKAKAFTSICYSADGEFILAGGYSKNICIYDIKAGILLKKFVVTQNRSLDNVHDFINRRHLTEFGNLNLIEHREATEGGDVSLKLPGVCKMDMSLRNVKPEIRIFSLQYAPTGQTFAAATTEGVLVYGFDLHDTFHPWLLDVHITSQSIREAFNAGEYSLALIMAFKLNDFTILKEIITNFPDNEVQLTVNSLAEIYIERLFDFLSQVIDKTNHLDAYFIWAKFLVIRLKHFLQLKLKATSVLSVDKTDIIQHTLDSTKAHNISLKEGILHILENCIFDEEM